MPKAELKTKPLEQTADELIAGVENDKKREEAGRLLELFRRATDAEPVVWTGGMIGFGDWHYEYESGREGDFFKVGFATRKARHCIYLMGGLDKHEKALERLGKWKRGAGCLYVNKLSDIDEDVLEGMVAKSWTDLCS